MSGFKERLRRARYAALIAAGRFRSPEPEFTAMSDYVKRGDTVVDVGANVGHYTRRFSKLVGETGRVFAFEPMPETYWHLHNNTRGLGNVSTFGVALSKKTAMVGMGIPLGHDHYWAAIGAGDVQALTVPLDSLGLARVDFLKIDAEGHEVEVLAGALETIQKHLPIIMMENGQSGVLAGLDLLVKGYRRNVIPGSPNAIWEARP